MMLSYRCLGKTT